VQDVIAASRIDKGRVAATKCVDDGQVLWRRRSWGYCCFFQPDGSVERSFHDENLPVLTGLVPVIHGILAGKSRV